MQVYPFTPLLGQLIVRTRLATWANGGKHPHTWAMPRTQPLLFSPRTAGCVNLCRTTEGRMVITAPVWGRDIFISLDNSLLTGLVSALAIWGYNIYHENYKIPL